MVNKSLFGLKTEHLVPFGPKNHLVHIDVIPHFLALQQHCIRLGIHCDIVSSYRSYTQQLSIWERKWRGELPVRDWSGKKLNLTATTREEYLDAILTWSAIPGASRHHWGTDIDVYDRQAVIDLNWSFQLVPEEYVGDGPCAELGNILDDQLAEFRFKRPYLHFLGGVGNEPWHISFAPVSEEYEEKLTADTLYDFISSVEFTAKDLILRDFDTIYERFILNKGVKK